MNRNATIVIVAAILVVGVGVYVFIISKYNTSPPPQQDCIHPPVLSSHEELVKAEELANKLKVDIAKTKSVEASSTFKASLSESLQNDYDKLSDENVTYLLFAQAIYCYLNLHTKAGDSMAQEFKDMLNTRHREFHHTQGAGEPLTQTERAELEASPYGNEALHLLDSLGK